MKIEFKDYKRIFSLTMLVLMALFWVRLFMCGDEQLNMFHQLGGNFFQDFLYVVDWTIDRDPYFWTTGELSEAQFRCYPPAALLIVYPFSKLIYGIYSKIFIGLIFYLIWYVFAGIMLYDKYNVKNKFDKYILPFSFLLSGVSLFAYVLGNLVIVAAFLVLFFVFEYKSENRVIRECAYISLALAAGFKLYPAIFGFLVIKEKKYKDAIRLIIYGILVFLLPFLFFKGGFENISLLIRNIDCYSDFYGNIKEPIHYTLNFRFFAVNIENPSIKHIIYNIFFIIDKFIVLAALIAAFFQKNNWKSIMLVSVSIVYISIFNLIYTAMFFFAAMVFFLNEATISKLNTYYFILIILILNPVQFVLRSGLDLTPYVINVSTTVLILSLIVDTCVEYITLNKVRGR